MPWLEERIGSHRHLLGGNSNRAAFRHRISRVHCKIKKCKFKLIWIGQRLGKPQWKMSINLYGRAKRALQKIGHSENEFRQVKRFQLELLPARERKHTLGERRAAVRSLQRIVKKFGENLIVWRKTPLHELKAALDRHEKIVEVVCNAAGQLSDRLHLLRLQEGLAGLFQR